MTEFLVATGQVISENPSLWNSFLHSFDVFKTWDFGPFKIILILLLIGLPILLIILIATGKLVLFNTMFGEGYGLKLITGTFGAGKTKNVFQSAYLWKMLNPDGIIISNLDYDFVDIVFDSKEDFDFVLKDLVQYVRDTNNIDELKSSINFPPIKIIVDEAHIYLFARDFKGFTKDILLVLTQCRKRDISIDFITQELGQIDVFIRRLAPYIQYFQTLPFGLRKQSMLYSLDAEATSMRDELSFEEVDSSYLLPDSWALFFKKKLQRFYDQKYLTKYVIGGLHKYCNEEDRESIKELKISHRYEEFKKILSDKVKSFRTPKIHMSLVNRFYSFVNKYKIKSVGEKVLKLNIKSNSQVISDYIKVLGTDKFNDYLNKDGLSLLFLSDSVDFDIYDYQNKIINCIESNLSEHDRIIVDSFIYKKKVSEKSRSIDLLDLLGFTYEYETFDDGYEAFDIVLRVSPDGLKRFNQFDIESAIKYACDNNLFSKLSSDEYDKYSDIIQKQEDSSKESETTQG